MYQNTLPVLFKPIYNVQIFLLRSHAFGQVGWQRGGRELWGTGVVGHVINSVWRGPLSRVSIVTINNWNKTAPPQHHVTEHAWMNYLRYAMTHSRLAVAYVYERQTELQIGNLQPSKARLQYSTII